MPLIVDFIRHAESRMNVDMANAEVPFIGGRQNEIDLSELGMVQAANLGFFALAEAVVPTDFYCSPAVRAVRTHKLSCAVMGLEVKPIIDERLQELDQGSWTNQPRSLYDDPKIKSEMIKLGSDFAPPGGESMNMVYQRTNDFLESLEARMPESPRHIWVHTHGVVIKTYVGKLLGWSHEQTYKTPIDNASLTRIVRNGDTWQVTFINHSTSQP